MNIIPLAFYNSGWKIVSLIFVLAIALGGYFIPILGLAVPLLIAIALIMNARKTRSFCSGFCPNGRTLSFTMKAVSRNKVLPSYLYSTEFRRMLCGFMMFCVISLLARSDGSVMQIGRVFWAIYIASIGISTISGLLFKPRSWCAYCPMGTLQDTMKSPSHRRKSTPRPSLPQ